ncbi:alpha/beta hydrolase [Thalassolituus sp. LLYu03]|uniref:alpha/beta hydrolase n=1 Tax=Thalassolituus sp. LLYu03 TaxID=3421656 RepID=UPI003D2E39B1
MSYANQAAWQEIQGFLPSQYQLSPATVPQEEYWEWEGHRIHLDQYRNDAALAKVILFHGVGTNGRQMMTILGCPLAQKGYETIAIDMPGYGETRVNKQAKVSYDTWVRAAVAFIQKELDRDERPVFLYGLSAGGMLAYHAAAHFKHDQNVKGIIGMTFLDQRLGLVRRKTTLTPLIGILGAPLMTLMAKTPLAGFKMPMWLASKMHTLVNDKKALNAFMKDRTSAGNWASIRFLSSYMNYQPAVEPENFDVCPIILTQPAADRWTPLNLSTPFLERINQVPVDVVMLDNGGHYPLEEKSLNQLLSASVGFIQKNTG